MADALKPKSLGPAEQGNVATPPWSRAPVPRWLVAAAALAACAPAAPPPSQIVSTSQQPLRASAGDARDTPAELQIHPVAFMAEDGTVICSLGGDGSFRCGDRTVGQLSSNGIFTFDQSGGLVTARITGEGRIGIVAARGADLDKLPGTLPRDLKEGGGPLTSGYTIHDDGSATIAGARPIVVDDAGLLSDGTHTLRVQGPVTPAARRTVVFLYVLLSMFTP